MKIRHLIPFAAPFLLVGTLAAQQGQIQGDPNNPNNQQGIGASIMEHGTGLDQGNIGPFVTVTDKQFADLFATRAMLQIQLGQLVMDHADSRHVILVAQRMRDDYGKWQTGLQRIAARLELKLPTDLDAKRKAVVSRLSALKGAEFDQAYLKEMVLLQTQALTATQHEAANAGVTGFRNWAGLMMPTLEEHLKLTKQTAPPVTN